MSRPRARDRRRARQAKRSELPKEKAAQKDGPRFFTLQTQRQQPLNTLAMRVANTTHKKTRGVECKNTRMAHDALIENTNHSRRVLMPGENIAAC
jgi:hypothetical protein